MIGLLIIVSVYELYKLWRLGLSSIEITQVMVCFLLLAISISQLILNVLPKYTGIDFTGVKLKLTIGLSILWIILSAYIINYFVSDILKIIKSIF